MQFLLVKCIWKAPDAPAGKHAEIKETSKAKGKTLIKLGGCLYIADSV